VPGCLASQHGASGTLSVDGVTFALLVSQLAVGAVDSVVHGSEVSAQWAQSLLGSDDADIVRASQLPHTVEEINCHVDFSHPTFVYT
jgi:hypothetical protein